MFVTLEFNLNSYISNFYETFLLIDKKIFTLTNLDNLEVANYKNLDFKLKLSGIEQVVDVILVTMPENIWSVYGYNFFFIQLLIFILILPFIYCLIFLFLFLFYQLSHLYFGKISKFEDKSINFTFLLKNYW